MVVLCGAMDSHYPPEGEESAANIISIQYPTFFSLTPLTISADADGGPRSRVRTAGHSVQPPIDVSEKISVHMSA